MCRFKNVEGRKKVNSVIVSTTGTSKYVATNNCQSLFDVCCDTFVHCLMLYCCNWCNRKLNGQSDMEEAGHGREEVTTTSHVTGCSLIKMD